jgi:LVIVD repeat-containing protein
MKRTQTFALLVVALLAISSAQTGNSASGQEKLVGNPSPYLFIWTADDDEKESDFLAVVDANPSSQTYGEVLTTLQVGVRSTYPHHTEYEFSPPTLFANGWAAGKTFIIDLSNPTKPKLSGQFKDSGAYSFPHSFARLPNGNVLATYQVRREDYEPPGGLVELDARGRVLRTSSAAVPGFEKKLLWPYSLTVLPKIDRVITTSTEMGLPKWAMSRSHDAPMHEHTLSDTNHIQIWSLRDLRLLATVPLPSAPGGKAQLNPAEPRVLPDGTLYVNTFNCGLYRVVGVQTAKPTAEFVYAFPGAGTKFECAVPVVVGKFWIQTDPSLPGLIALDISNPAKPVEVSRLVFDAPFDKTHWVAADRSASRLVVTGNNRSWVLIVNLNGETGALSLDENFKVKGADHPGVDFDRQEWPHGATGKGVVHGALFGQ